MKKPQREHLKAYQPTISPKMFANCRNEFFTKLDTLQNVSLTEYATFVAENRMYILNNELQIIRSQYFGFPTIQHSEELVKFYTGLPNASQFYYLNSMLQGWIFSSYIKWKANEKHGFLNHTLMALMKLRLNMPDQELAERFGIEAYIINMTLRTWLPAIYICIYKNCEEIFRGTPNHEDYLYSRAVDVVEICFETPPFTKMFRNNQNETRKAVLSVRHDGFVNYASPAVSPYRPDADTIKHSRFANTCYNWDMVALHPEHLQTVAAMGIACRRMPTHAEFNIKEAVTRISQFRILSGIPEEYRTNHEYIFPVCAALSNFCLAVEEDDPNFPALED